MTERKQAVRLEVRRLTALAWPIVLTQVALMLMGTVDFMMVGRAGVVEVGAVMLGNVWKMGTILVGMGVVFGISPLVSQAHGAGDARGAALALQNGVVLGVLISLPLAALWWFAEPALLQFGQDPEIARLAGRYLAVQIPSLPFFLVWVAQREYLQGRGLLMPTFWIALGANVLNALLNWALIFGNWGAPALGGVGAGVATSVLQVLLPLATLVWIRTAGLHRSAWVPWSRASFDPYELMRVVRLGGPIALALLFEMWAFQIVSLWSGLLGDVQLAAHSFVLNLASLSFMVPLGVSLAAVTRVGNLIGAGKPDDAQRAAWVAFALGAGGMGVSAIGFVLGRNVLPGLYTDDLEVARLAAAVLPIAAAFQLVDGTQVVGSGILRGMGKTRPAAVMHLFGFYGLALPLAWWLTFRDERGLAGLWWGLALGLTAVAVLMLGWVARSGPATVRSRA